MSIGEAGALIIGYVFFLLGVTGVHFFVLFLGEASTYWLVAFFIGICTAS